MLQNQVFPIFGYRKVLEIGETLFCACDEDESGGTYEYFISTWT